MTTEPALHESTARIDAVQARALSISCPKCNQPAGAWCRTAKGQKLPDLHAGRMFGSIPQQAQPGLAGPCLAIHSDPALHDRLLKGTTAVSTAQPEESTVSKSKLMATTAKNRREPGARPAGNKPLPKKPDLKAVNGGKAGTPAPAKQKSKSQIVHDMLTSAKGATRKELSEATGWPSVNLTVAAARADMVIEEDEKTGRVKLVAKAKKS